MKLKAVLGICLCLWSVFLNWIALGLIDVAEVLNQVATVATNKAQRIKEELKHGNTRNIQNKE
jgi:hypothetical protein